MGGYKNKKGKTRVGNFLKSVKGIAPEILNIAGTLTGSDGLKSLSKAIKGSNSITPEDKEVALRLIDLDLADAEQITKRWESDMTSDSWLSKNVRPLTLLYLLFFMSIIILTDSIDSIPFTVAQPYITLLGALLMTVFAAFFGSRFLNKNAKIKKGL